MHELMRVVAAGAIAAPALGQFVEPVDLIHTWTGESPSDRFGFINRAIGDVDGDGVGDLLVGAPDSDDGAMGAGKVYVYSGATGELIRTHTGTTNDHLGYEASGIGDLDADGRSEYVVSAPGTVNFQQIFGSGRVHVYDGATGAILHTFAGEAPFDTFGVLCAGAGNVLQDGAGDVDADATPDILIGAILHDAGGANAGRVYVFSGATLEPIHVIDGEGAGDFLGIGLGGLGDLDGDGCAEFVAGASNAGRAYVHHGKTGEQLPYSPLEPAPSGASFANLFASGPGDLDSDGTCDVFVTDLGDTTEGAQTGRAYVFSGATGEIIHDWVGSQAGEGFGVGRGCGDVDADGVPDVIVSAYRSAALVPFGGRSFVMSGATGEVIRSITGTIPGDLLGWSTVGVMDVNDDGALDFMLSAVGNDDAGLDAGRVYVIAGEIDCEADVNGDGSLDILDFVAFQTLFTSGDPSADCTDDDVLNVLDFVCFQGVFLAGCD